MSSQISLPLQRALFPDTAVLSNNGSHGGWGSFLETIEGERGAYEPPTGSLVCTET